MIISWGDNLVASFANFLFFDQLEQTVETRKEDGNDREWIAVSDLSKNTTEQKHLSQVIYSTTNKIDRKNIFTAVQ